MEDILIEDTWRIGHMIAKGGYGSVHYGTNIRTDEEVALKFVHISQSEDINNRHIVESFHQENRMNEAVAGGVGMPRVLFFGQVDEHWVLVSELLGPTLEDLAQFCHDPGSRVPSSLSVKTILLIAIEAIARVKHIHSRGIVHRDLKPENFVMGAGKNGNTLYTIDFGLAIRFPPDEVAEATEGKEDKVIPFEGTFSYASIRNHFQAQQGWADDLEGLAYMFRRSITGTLPWDDGHSLYSTGVASMRVGKRSVE